jgi:phosphoglycolate phosphatase
MRVILFDIDGTLVSTGGAGRMALERGMAGAFGVPPTSDGISLSGRTDRGIARDLFGAHGIAETEENWQRFRRAYLAALPGTLAERAGRVLPGVADLLSQLAGREDTAVGLLTGNIREGARLKLTYYQIFHHFGPGFGGFGDVHLERDHVAREALESARAHLGRERAPTQVWVVGDTPLDVRCAHSIGARAVAVATGEYSVDVLQKEGADAVVPDLSTAVELLLVADGGR